MADMLSDAESGTWHRDLRPTEIQKNEERVSETIDAIMGFMDPFCIDDKEHLHCVSSGARVPSENEPDILNAEDRGNGARGTFITDWLEKHDKFFEPIKNLKTMEDMGKKVKVKSPKK